MSTLKQYIKKTVLGTKRPMKAWWGVPGGIKMNLDPQFDTQIILGLAEAEITGLFKRIAPSAQVFFDIGAASGFYSVLFGKYNKNAPMYLFDGDPNFSKIQKENLELNHFSNKYYLYSMFVSDQNTPSAITIDSIIENEKIPSQKLLAKIDVEGAELRVLQGMKDVLQTRKVNLLIETHSLQLEQDCLQFLAEMGYEQRVIKNAWWRSFLPEQRIIEHNRWIYASNEQK